MLKSEAELQQEFSRSWFKLTQSYEKVPDTGFHKKRYDCWALDRGQFYAMELKLMKKPGAFNLEKIEEHQYDYLLLDQMNGAMSYILIGIDCELTPQQMKRYNINQSRIQTIVYEKIDWWISLRAEEQKSIDFGFLVNMPKLERYEDFNDSGNKKAYWNILPLLKPRADVAAEE